MDQQAPPPPPPQPQAPQPQQKKKMGPLGWILIGCGGIVLIGTLIAVAGGVFVFNKAKKVAGDFKDNPVRATAVSYVKLNPELELVETDDAAGTITIRDKNTGEVGTFDWSEVEQGRFKFESEDGESMTFDARGSGKEGVVRMENADGERTTVLGGGGDLPDWFPTYPGASVAEASFSASAQGTHTEIFAFTSDDPVTEVMEWYQEELEDLGFELAESTYARGGVQGGSLSGKTADGKRTVNVAFSEADGGTQVGVNSTEKE